MFRSHQSPMQPPPGRCLPLIDRPTLRTTGGCNGIEFTPEEIWHDGRGRVGHDGRGRVGHDGRGRVGQP